jgi:hypothetical protein
VAGNVGSCPKAGAVASSDITSAASHTRVAARRRLSLGLHVFDSDFLGCRTCSPDEAPEASIHRASPGKRGSATPFTRFTQDDQERFPRYLRVFWVAESDLDESTRAEEAIRLHFRGVNRKAFVSSPTETFGVTWQRRSTLAGGFSEATPGG